MDVASRLVHRVRLECDAEALKGVTVHRAVAGLDVYQATVVATVRVPGPSSDPDANDADLRHGDGRFSGLPQVVLSRGLSSAACASSARVREGLTFVSTARPSIPPRWICPEDDRQLRARALAACAKVCPMYFLHALHALQSLQGGFVRRTIVSCVCELCRRARGVPEFPSRPSIPPRWTCPEDDRQ